MCYICCPVKKFLNRVHIIFTFDVFMDINENVRARSSRLLRQRVRMRSIQYAFVYGPRFDVTRGGNCHKELCDASASRRRYKLNCSKFHLFRARRVSNGVWLVVEWQTHGVGAIYRQYACAYTNTI